MGGVCGSPEAGAVVLARGGRREMAEEEGGGDRVQHTLTRPLTLTHAHAHLAQEVVH